MCHVVQGYYWLQNQNNILGDSCLGEGPRQRPSHVFPNHWMSISYEPFWVQVIIIENLSKDLTTLLNLWHSWWKSIWNTYGVGHNSKLFRNWKLDSLLFLCCIDWYKDDLFNYTFTRIIWGWEPCPFNWIMTFQILLWHMPIHQTKKWEPISTTFMKRNALLLLGQLGVIIVKQTKNHVERLKNY